MQAVTLVKMSPREFEKFRSVSQKGLANSLSVAKSIDSVVAQELAEKSWCSALPEGQDTAGHFFLTAHSENCSVGYVWYALLSNPKGKVVYVYDIFIEIEERRKSYGRQVMELVEAEARLQGASRIELRVFSHNLKAAYLYRALGYEEEAVYMGKCLHA